MSFDVFFDLTAGVSVFYFYNVGGIVFFSPPADGGKKKVDTTLPRIFIHVVCQFNSIAFAIQLVFWRVLQFP